MFCVWVSDKDAPSLRLGFSVSSWTYDYVEGAELLGKPPALRMNWWNLAEPIALQKSWKHVCVSFPSADLFQQIQIFKILTHICLLISKT